MFDYVKVFDRVVDPTLINKLASICISGNLLVWIESFLAGRTMCVSLNGFQGETLSVTSGVPQGSVLCPLLFLPFINHLGSYNFLGDVRLLS